MKYKKDGTEDKRSIGYRKKKEALAEKRMEYNRRRKLQLEAYSENIIPKEREVGGRPPQKVLDDRLEELGKDLVEWIKDPKGGRHEINWVKWYHLKHGLTPSDWTNLQNRQGFRMYYNVAKQIMTSNIVSSKEIHHSYGHRYISLYDPELHEHEEHKQDLQSKRRIREKKKELQENEIALKRFQKSISDGTLLEELSNKN